MTDIPFDLITRVNAIDHKIRDIDNRFDRIDDKVYKLSDQVADLKSKRFTIGDLVSIANEYKWDIVIYVTMTVISTLLTWAYFTYRKI